MLGPSLDMRATLSYLGLGPCLPYGSMPQVHGRAMDAHIPGSLITNNFF